jgi:hypothetical protein
MPTGIRVISVSENEDGSADIEVEITTEFKNSLKKRLGMKRWSNNKFQKFVIQALNNHIEYISATNG